MSCLDISADAVYTDRMFCQDSFRGDAISENHVDTLILLPYDLLINKHEGDVMSTERNVVRKVRVTGDGGCQIVAFTDGKDWWVKDFKSPFVSYLARPTGLRCGEFHIYCCVFPRSSVRWNKKVDRVYLKKVQFSEIRRMRD